MVNRLTNNTNIVGFVKKLAYLREVKNNDGNLFQDSRQLDWDYNVTSYC